MIGRKYRIIICTVVGLVIGAPVAVAEYPVIDVTAIAQAINQLKELKTQVANQLEELVQLKAILGVMSDVKAFANDIATFTSQITDAIGSVTTLKLPIPNLEKMAAQTKGGLRCLMPDGLQWGIKLTDLNLGSICDTSSVYRSALFLDSKVGNTLSPYEQIQIRTQVKKRRKALLEDTTVRSLALADVQLKQAGELNDATDSLQSDLNSAKTLQDRSHVLDQIAIAQLRGQAQQLQILAQMLKLQAAQVVASGSSDKSDEAIVGEEK